MTKIIIAYIISLVLFSSCSNEKKISKAVATLKKYDRLDDTCAANFPVIERVDSAEYKNSKAIIDSMAMAIVKTQLANDSEIDLLQSELDEMKADSSIECGQINEALDRLLSAERRKSDDLAASNKLLKESVKSIKPVIKEVENTAKYNALMDKYNAQKDSASQYKASYEAATGQLRVLEKRMKGKVLVPWWVFLIIGLSIGGGVIYKLKK